MALISDLRAAIRALLAARGFTGIALLTLTASLALVAAVLTVVNAYVLRSLPYPEADRLYRVDYAPPGEDWPRGLEPLDWSTLGDVIELSIAWDLDVFYLLGRDYPESAPGAWVTPGYLSGLGIRAALGRSFSAEDFSPSNAPVALISHRLWQTRFGGDARVIGSTFNAYVSDRPEEPESFTIIGVLPADLWHLNVYTELLTPLKAPSFPYQVRVRDGVSAQLAAERIDALVRSGVSALPPHYGVRLTLLHDSYVAQLKPMFWSVIAAAALVVLIASANIAVLMIVRGRRRARELAVRLALGASYARVARLVAFEGALLGAVATTLALITAAALVPAAAPLVERSLDRRVPGGLEALRLDWATAAATLGCAALVTSLLVLVPIMLLWRGHWSVSAAASGRGWTDEPRSGRTRAVLIAVEIAASLTLLAGAALMAESALRMLRVDFGIHGDNVITAGLALRQRSFPETADRARFYARLEDELHGVSGSSAVAFGDWWPLQGSRPRRAEGSSAEVIATANPFRVSSQYFDAVGIQLLDGRAFDRQDRLGSEAVAIVSASLASRLWPGSRAIGERLKVYEEDSQPAHTATVVGVAADVLQSHLDRDLLDAYFPLAQRASRFAFVYLREPRTNNWESELRSAIARVNPEVALGAPRHLADGLEQERARPRFLAYLLSTFAVLSTALALVGMHGVIAYGVRQRQREIAVRIALGATPRSVTKIFLRYGMTVLAAGLATGVPGALGLGRVLQGQLFGVTPAEPRVLVAIVIVFAIVALPAVLWPAWRAATVDPMVVLKDD